MDSGSIIFFGFFSLIVLIMIIIAIAMLYHQSILFICWVHDFINREKIHYKNEWQIAHKNLRMYLDNRNSITFCTAEEMRLRQIELGAYMLYLAACNRSDPKGISTRAALIEVSNPS